MFTVIIFVHTISTGVTETIRVNHPKYPSQEMCEAARPSAEGGYKRFLEIRFAPKFTIESKCVADKPVKEGV